MGDPGGPDRVYLFTPATTTTYSFNTCAFQGHPDTMISIRQADCVSGTEVDCNDDSAVLCIPPAGGPWLSEMASVPLSAGQDYYIVVDGYASAFGNYTIDVNGIVCDITPTEDTTFSSAKALYR